MVKSAAGARDQSTGSGLNGKYQTLDLAGPLVTAWADKSVPFFGTDLDEGTLKALRDYASVADVPENTILLTHGRSQPFYIHMVSGCTYSTLTHPGAPNLVLSDFHARGALVAPGDGTGNFSIYTVTTLSKSKVVLLRREAVLALLREPSYLANRLARMEMAGYIRAYENALAAYGMLEHRMLYLYYLLSEPVQSYPGVRSVPRGLSRELVATALNVAPSEVSRKNTVLKNSGWLWEEKRGPMSLTLISTDLPTIFSCLPLPGFPQVYR